MDHGALLAETESCRDREDDTDGLDDQRPLAEVASDDESRENRLDLGYTRATCIWSEVFHQQGGQCGEEECPGDVEQVGHDVSSETTFSVYHEFRPSEPLKWMNSVRELMTHAQTKRDASKTTYLRAIAAVEGHRLVRGPAALLSIEPKSLRTDAELEVGHPCRSNINHASYKTSH